jgi:hypothetical protein
VVLLDWWLPRLGWPRGTQASSDRMREIYFLTATDIARQTALLG